MCQRENELNGGRVIVAVKVWDELCGVLGSNFQRDTACLD
jgi:hypothetical protein